MFYNNISYVNAACHAKKLRDSLARLDLRVATLVAPGQRLTLSDAISIEISAAQ